MFTITSRGVIIAGHIIDGEINKGDRIDLNVKGVGIKLNILSVEDISSSNVGLRVEELSEDLIEAVRLFLGQVVMVLSGV